MTLADEIEIAMHCLGVQAEQEVCEECPVYLDGGIACREAARSAISALKEVQQYREIGTVEECREARNKQMLKNPQYINGGISVCRECGNELKRCYDYCPDCGQAIQWEHGNLEGINNGT